MDEKPVVVEKVEPVVEPAKVEVEAPKTMEQIQETVVPEKKETVGLDKFLEIKNQNKEQKQVIKDLEKKLAAGVTPQEISSDIESLSAEYPDVDKNFLNKLAKTIRSQVEKDAEDKIESRLKPLEQKEKAEKIDTAFNKHFTIAMETMPEFKNIVNPNVIKTLSLDPNNANKTFSQIIEETYGGALTGKRTIESTKPGGGKDAEPLDFEKARKNTEYFKEVMGNKDLKEAYNERMLKEGF